MRGVRSTLLVTCVTVLAAVLAMVLSAPVASGDQRSGSRTVFAFTDPDITESSGLVAEGRLMYTVNDSGDGPLVYAVDVRTGDTVATTTYSSDPVTDVEALAPGNGALWVGDIGDNDAERDSVEVYRVVPRAGSVAAPRFRLAYPDGAHDAEALVVHPRTHRLYVVTKNPAGGTIYAAPRHLAPHGVNELTPIGRVPGLVTDGAFLRDGRRLLLRGYGTVSSFTFPGLRLLGTATLPRQRQGEGLAVGGSGEVYLSSEGVFSDVLQVFLPASLTAPVQGGVPPRPTATPEAGRPSTTPSAQADRASDVLATDDAGWLFASLGLLALVVSGWWFVTVARPRGRRRP